MKRETIRVTLDIEVVQLLGAGTVETGTDPNMLAKAAANEALNAAHAALVAWGKNSAGRAVGVHMHTEVLPEVYDEVRR